MDEKIIGKSIGSGILALGIILSTIIGAMTFYKVRSFDNTLSVTGSTKQRVTSDQVKWNSNISRIVTLVTLQDGYTQIAKDQTDVKNFLKKKGVADDAINISPVLMQEIYDNQNYGGGEKRYTLRQNITVQSDKVNEITSVAKDLQELINKGVVISSDSLEYYYSKISDLRVNLLSDAVKDAKARADKLAESSGKQVGQMKSAASGVVQVMTPNSTDVSDYGMYDTSSIEKDVMVTVRATFTLK